MWKEQPFNEGLRTFNFAYVLPLFLTDSLKPYMGIVQNEKYEAMHYFSKMPLLLIWHLNSSRSTDEDNLIAQFFFEMISAGAIKEALLQMQFAWLIVYYISL